MPRKHSYGPIGELHRESAPLADAISELIDAMSELTSEIEQLDSALPGAIKNIESQPDAASSYEPTRARSPSQSERTIVDAVDTTILQATEKWQGFGKFFSDLWKRMADDAVRELAHIGESIAKNAILPKSAPKPKLPSGAGGIEEIAELAALAAAPSLMTKSTGKGLESLLGGLAHLLGFAEGGRPPTDTPSVVGERGPELFVPDTAGTVVPTAPPPISSDAPGATTPGPPPSATPVQVTVNHYGDIHGVDDLEAASRRQAWLIASRLPVSKL